MTAKNNQWKYSWARLISTVWFYSDTCTSRVPDSYYLLLIQ